MPATEAALGYGAKFGIKGSGSTYVYVAEVTNITPPGMTRDTVDVTHLESPDKFKEYIAGLADTGEASITINYKPAVSDALMTAFLAEKDDFRILFPGGTVALDFAGIVTGYEPGDLVAPEEMTATFTVKASGKPVLTTVTP